MVAVVLLTTLLTPVALRGAFRLKSVQDVVEGLVEPDPALGEEVGLACVGQVETRLLEGVPWHRRPKRVFVIDNIPCTATGKVQRSEVSEIIRNRFL